MEPASETSWSVDYEILDEDPTMRERDVMTVWADDEETARREAEYSLRGGAFGLPENDFVIHEIRRDD